MKHDDSLVAVTEDSLGEAVRPVSPQLVASVIVRSKDKAATIARTLTSLREQSVSAEIIVVDSGSRDGTVDIARACADRVITIRPDAFSYGGALNLGARHADGDVCFAMSAHCAAPDARWMERSLEHYADPRVAGTNGLTLLPDGTQGDRPYRPTLAEATADPRWGFSNHAGSWRKSVVEAHPFRVDLRACEDKDWAWRVIGAGFAIVFDPDLYVSTAHRHADGVRAMWRRSYREGFALTALGKEPVEGVREAVAAWATRHAEQSRLPPGVRLLSPWRFAENWGTYAGVVAGRRRRTSAAVMSEPLLSETE